MRFADGYEESLPDYRIGTGRTGWLYLGLASVVGLGAMSGLASTPALFGLRSDLYLVIVKGVSVPITDVGTLGMALFIALGGIALVAMLK